MLAGAAIATLSLLWTSFASAQSAESVPGPVAVVETVAPDALVAEPTDVPAAVPVQAVVGPRLPESSLVSRAAVERRMRQATSPAPTSNVVAENPGFRRNVALLAVGIAAIAIGSAVDDDGAGTVLVLGGAGLTLYGLYQILK